MAKCGTIGYLGPERLALACVYERHGPAHGHSWQHWSLTAEGRPTAAPLVAPDGTTAAGPPAQAGPAPAAPGAITLKMRRADESFWERGGVLVQEHLHQPFLVFHLVEGELTVRTHRQLAEVLSYRDDVLAAKQWPGATRSDFFWFSIGQLRDALRTLAMKG